MRKIIRYSLIFLIILIFRGTGIAAFDQMGPYSPSPYRVFSTMTAYSLDKGNSAVSVSAEKSGSPDYYRFSTQFAMGITDRLMVGINIPYVENNISGVEDIDISLKNRFNAERKFGPSIAYLLTGSIKSGTKALSTDGWYGAGLIFSKKVGPFKGHANLIYSTPGESGLKDEIRASGGIEFSASHDLDVIAEIYGKKSSFSDEVDKLETRIGYRIENSEGVFYTLGAGAGLYEKAPDYRIMLSITYTFPKDSGELEKSAIGSD